MRFAHPLLRATLLRRYKRFFADVRLETGEDVTAHCPNSGAMLGLNLNGAKAWVSRADNPKRKLGYTLEILESEGVCVGVNTMHPNAIVAEAIAADKIPPLSGYETLRREVVYGTRSRVDLLLESPNRPKCWVEIKNVHLKRGDLAQFPDSVTQRGAKHMGELAKQVEAGDRAVVIYLVQRQDCAAFAPAADIDPTYAAAAEAASRAGVETLVLACTVTPEEITVARALPLASTKRT